MAQVLPKVVIDQSVGNALTSNGTDARVRLNNALMAYMQYADNVVNEVYTEENMGFLYERLMHDNPSIDNELLDGFTKQNRWSIVCLIFMFCLILSHFAYNSLIRQANTFIDSETLLSGHFQLFGFTLTRFKSWLQILVANLYEFVVFLTSTF